jgi:NAD(P)-dependent dehydrogenase (short-subunit alcohol dehydrogenase family)
MTDANKVWFITGISRGFGKALAEALLSGGDVVIGTTRDGKAPIEDTTGRLHTLALDVTNAAAIKDVIAQAHGLHGRLDVVVNNAGYGLLGSIEEATDDQIDNLFSVNFDGTRRVVQAVLPYLRKQRSGHIVNITSIAGLAPGAGSGFYAASKFAVEGLSQSLAREVEPLGIKVTLVEPGAFRTDFLSDHSIRRRGVGLSDYEKTAGATMKALEDMAGKQIGDPDGAATAIIEAVSSPEPPLHLVLGSDAFKRTLDMQTRFAAELETWKDVSLSTDF